VIFFGGETRGEDLMTKSAYASIAILMKNGEGDISKKGTEREINREKRGGEKIQRGERLRGEDTNPPESRFILQSTKSLDKRRKTQKQVICGEKKTSII